MNSIPVTIFAPNMTSAAPRNTSLMNPTGVCSGGEGTTSITVPAIPWAVINASHVTTMNGAVYEEKGRYRLMPYVTIDASPHPSNTITQVTPTGFR